MEFKKSRILCIMIAVILMCNQMALSQVSVSATAGTETANYSTLKGAFDKVNDGTHKGAITFEITANTTETASAVLNASGSGAASYSSLNIYPTSSGLSVSGNLNSPLIDLNGASNVTFDGRVNATGATKDLTITNTSTASTAGTSTFRFINDACSNSIKYCVLKGSSTSTSAGGILFFSTTLGTTGNDNNLIQYNDITNSSDANRPLNAIYSSGTATKENHGNTISNNNIFDYLSRSTGSYGIHLSSQTTSWNITENHFYETATFIPTGSVPYSAIYINNTSGTGFLVSDNFIGGSSPSCGGAAWTKTNAFNNIFYSIFLNVGTGVASNVHGNTIKNFSFSHSFSANWYGIDIEAGDVNVGTSSGNTIGSINGTGSIILNNAGDGASNFGIYVNSQGITDIQNNTIGSFTISNTSTNNSYFYGIQKLQITGNTTINNNFIGSTSTPSSIASASGFTTFYFHLYGIRSAGTGNVTISGNTVSNLRNGTASATGLVNGIVASNGTNTITNNVVRDLSNGNISSVTIIGISMTSTVASAQTVSGNLIFNLISTHATYSGSIYGLNYSGPTILSTVSKNFIHSISVTGASSTAAFINGLKIGAGTTNFSNNIISIGGNSSTTIYGIEETGASATTNSLFYNTVYIGGNPTTGTNISCALRSHTTNNLKDFRNNIFCNSRSNSGATGTHYAAYFNYSSSSNLTLDNNNYYAPGSGGMLGYYSSAPVTGVPLVSGLDIKSQNFDPQFVSAGGTSATDYVPQSSYLVGVSGTGILEDYANATRSGSSPSMGSFEYIVNEIDNVTVTASSGNPTGKYPSLRAALNSINGGLHQGVISVIINQSLTETASALINGSGTGNANYSSVLIYPAISGITVSGSLASPLIDLNGANNVTIDGRVNATGSAEDLIITNTSTSTTSGTSTIRFINDASSNGVNYCIIKGSSMATTGGTLFFSTTTGTTGSDDNIIEHNDITNAADANRPLNSVYSLGTSAKENSGNIIRNNNFFNFLSRTTASYAINISSFSTNWSILNNHFYETASFAPTANVDYVVININNSSGTDFIVSDNFIGGSSQSCGGTAWTKTNASYNGFKAIYISVGTGSLSNIQGNTLTNFNFSNSNGGISDWHGIQALSGQINIGNISSNVIGSSTGTGSISFSCGINGSTFYGINLGNNSAGAFLIQNNIIGSISLLNTVSNNSTNFYGINNTNSGQITITNNTIGSTNTANSIHANSLSTSGNQVLHGLYNSGSGSLTISGNVFANLTNATNNTGGGGMISGITVEKGTYSITNNIVRDLIISNGNGTLGWGGSINGISVGNSTSNSTIITGNTIYNLSNTHVNFTGWVTGIGFANGSTGNVISHNFIHSLSVGAQNSTGVIAGIRMNGGSSTCSNNIITLGNNARATIHGIYEVNGNYIYFNTVHIKGSPTTLALNSHALFSAGTTGTKDIRNNIFSNERSNSGATGKHYAIGFQSAFANLTLDYNNYYVSGSGGVIGTYAGPDVVAIPVVSGRDVNSQNFNPQFISAGSNVQSDYMPTAGFLAGVSGTGILTDYNHTSRNTSLPAMGAYDYPVSVINNVTVTATAGNSMGKYPNLRTALNSINGGTHQGIVSVSINQNITETATAIIYASGSGNASYTSVSIFPSISGLTVSGNLEQPLLEFNKASNVTLDGRVNMVGTTKDLTITNTSTASTAGTSTIRFINDATLNVVKYCNIKGSSTDPSGGILFFSTTTGTTGNDENIIENNDITSASDANRPLNAIYSLGTSTKENSENIIRNNNFFNFFSRSTASFGINLGNHTTAWNISNNSFYETSSFAPTASVAYVVVNINNTSGNDFTISGNNIGGNTSFCGGTPWTKTNAFANAFTGIYLSAGIIIQSNIQGNTIQNFNYSNNNAVTANWFGINIAGGAVNAGTINANTIGESTGTGSITFSTTGNGNSFYGINVSSTGTTVIQNNKIGSITLSANSTNALTFYGINKTAVVGTITIRNNTIGSESTTSSINSASGFTTFYFSLYGINSAATGSTNIISNTISNLSNGSSAISGIMNGINTTAGTNNISNNTIRDLIIGNNNTGTNNSSSISGISQTGTTGAQTVSGNSIFNLTNNHASFAGNVNGLYYAGSTTSSVVSDNFIYNLSVTGASSTTANIYGIKINAGATTYSNNIITLGGNTRTIINGIYETGTVNNNNNLYFNTVYLSGGPTAGTSNSYAFWSNATTNTRDFRNNIFNNARSNSGATGKHYAAYFNYSSSTNLTLDNNVYHAGGTGGVLGYRSADVTSIPIISGLDAASYNTNPAFLNTSGSNPDDFIPSIKLEGVSIVGITKDQQARTRFGTPQVGALEGHYWLGTQDQNFANPNNWSMGTIPTTGTKVYFHTAPNNPCVLDQNRTFESIVNSQSTYKLVLNGKELTITKDLNLTNGAQIDASALNSKLILNGPDAQVIPFGSFVNDEIYNLEINNLSGVNSASNLSVINNLNFVDGMLNTNSNLVTIMDGATITGTNSSKYINGSCRKVGNQAFTFPIGSGNKYAPIGISAPASATDAFDASYTNGNPNSSYSISNLGAGLHHVSKNEFWMLSRTNGSSSVSVTLSWDAARSGQVNNLGDLRVAHWKGGQWESEGNTGTTGNMAAGTIKSNMVSSFSPFTLGSETSHNVLPVKLLSFDAKKQDIQVELTWQTAQEVNNARFEIEHSIDGRYFEKIGEVAGKGNSTAINSYTFNHKWPSDGINYYRLKQVDLDSKFTYSKVIAISIGQQQNRVSFYPNPVVHEAGLNISLVKAEKLEARIVDNAGRVLFQQQWNVQKGSSYLPVNTNGLTNGLYFIELRSESIREVKQFIKQ